MERKYSVAELDRMRRAIRTIVQGDYWAHSVPLGLRDPIDAEAEDRLRTYMLNGTSPEELEEAAAAVVRKRTGA